jgi:hypothetical protein
MIRVFCIYNKEGLYFRGSNSSGVFLSADYFCRIRQLLVHLAGFSAGANRCVDQRNHGTGTLRSED